MTDQLIADLTAAREIVRERWYKGGLTDGHSVCAVGAIRESITGRPSVTMASPEFMRVIAADNAVIRNLDGLYGGHIASFNDADATTKQDVLNLFDKALADLGGLA